MAHSLAGEGVGESQFRLGDIHCGTLYTLYTVHILYNIQYMYFVHSSTVLQFSFGFVIDINPNDVTFD
jgi:hypothetical protein